MEGSGRRSSSAKGGGTALSETRFSASARHRAGSDTSSRRPTSAASFNHSHGLAASARQSALTKASPAGASSADGGRPRSAASALGTTKRSKGTTDASSVKQKQTKPKLPKLLSIPEKRAAGLLGEKEDTAQARPRRPRPESAPVTDGSRGSKPVAAPFGVPKSRVLELELAMREALKAVHSAARSAKVHLVEAFNEMDDGSGEVNFLDFADIWVLLGVTLTENEARAMCRYHGGSKDGGNLPYKTFIDRMVRGAARQLADGPVCRGYPVTDGDFRKKIIYPKCRKGVYAPSDFDVALADRSTMEPDAALELEFVYGYDGVTNNAPNLFFTGGEALGQIAYYTAAVGVVYDRRKDTQRHFLGHTKDICCMTLCAAEVELNGMTYPPLTLAATGQRKAVEDPDNEEMECPFVAIWDVCTCEEVARVNLDQSARAAVAVAFSPDGSLLTTVGCDNQHTVTIWDWRKPEVGQEGGPGGKPVGWVGEGGGFTERPIAVYGAKWDPHAKRGNERFCTWGMKHLKTWTCDPSTGRWSSQSMSFGDFGVDNVLSCEFLRPRTLATGETPSGAVVTGMPDGTLLVWRNGKAVRRVQAHAKGPRTIQPDGTVAWGGGVRALRLRKDGLTLLSGGADGCVMLWDASGNKIGDLITKPLPLKSTAIGPGPAPAIRALDCMPGSDVFVAGTDKCDVWEVSERPVVVMKGHSADLYAICWHPTKPDVFISAAESGRVFVWDAVGTGLLRHGTAGFPARAVAVSNTPLAGSMVATSRPGEAKGAPERSHHIAVGGKNGELVILDEGTFQPVFRDRPCKSGIEDAKYSPDDTRLALSSRDQTVDVYLVHDKKRAYVHAHRCVGHSATVRHLDWSADSRTIGTDGADYELLYWDALTGKQQSASQQNTRWATWTRVLGFPVMGVWAPGSDGTDVNAADRSPDGNYVVTADDYGGVKLFAYPSVVEGSGYREYRGHSSFVLNVRFSPALPGSSAQRVITAGGRDRSIFQYKVVHVEPPAPRPKTPELEWLPLDMAGKSYGWRRPDQEPTAP